MRGEIVCRYCGKGPFKNIQSLKAHLGHCKTRKQARKRSTVIIDPNLWNIIHEFTDNVCDFVERWLRFGLAIEALGRKEASKLGSLPSNLFGVKFQIETKHVVARLRRRPEKYESEWIYVEPMFELEHRPKEYRVNGHLCIFCKHLGEYDPNKRFRICEKRKKAIRFPLSRRKCNYFECSSP